MVWIKNNQFITLLMGVVFICSVLFVTNMVETNNESYNEIFINDGDTLWSLSEQYRGKTPKEEWIAEVMAANQLPTQMIQTGAVLKIPESLHQYAPDQGVELAGDTE
ncbi:MAG: LysM peptidoglycan-binding domain-containing protein [Paenisporosarcina sp.]